MPRHHTRVANRTRAVTVAHTIQWRLTRGTWRAVGHPKLKIEPVVKSQRGRTWAMWILKPRGLQFRDYTEAMLAAEDIAPQHWKKAARAAGNMKLGLRRPADRKKPKKKMPRPRSGVARAMILAGIRGSRMEPGERKPKEREERWRREDWGDAQTRRRFRARLRKWADTVLRGRQSRPEAVARLRAYLAPRIGAGAAEREINRLLRSGWNR